MRVGESGASDYPADLGAFPIFQRQPIAGEVMVQRIFGQAAQLD